MSFETIRYATDGPVASITLDRPERLNTIVPPMPDEVEAAVERATRDGEVKVLVPRGAGRAFCGGYDFGEGFKHWGDALETDGRWDPGKDFAMATAPQLSPTRKLGSVQRARADGVRAAIEDRDGPFGDYSQAPPERRPDPRNVIDP